MAQESAGLGAVRELNGVSDIWELSKVGAPDTPTLLDAFSATRGCKHQRKKKIRTCKKLVGKIVHIKHRDIGGLWTVKKRWSQGGESLGLLLCGCAVCGCIQFLNGKYSYMSILEYCTFAFYTQ